LGSTTTGFFSFFARATIAATTRGVSAPLA
jgi:hypothetical protein